MKNMITTTKNGHPIYLDNKDEKCIICDEIKELFAGICKQCDWQEGEWL